MSRRRTLNAAQRAVLIRTLGHDLEWSTIVESLVKRRLMSCSTDVMILPYHACKLYRLTKRGINVAVQLVTTAAHVRAAVRPYSDLI